MHPIARRIASAPLVFLVVALVTFALPRVLRPDLYPGEALIPGTVHDFERVFLHFDLGRACGWQGCPPVRRFFDRGAATDLWLLVGALGLGIAAGLLGGVFCARHPRSPLSRVLQTVATTVYCVPVYVAGLALLLLFHPTFGLIHVPFFFDVQVRDISSPLHDPWEWFSALLVPWIVLGAPFAAMCLRLTLALTDEAMGEEYVKTAYAKGLSTARVVRRHAAPSAYVATASFVAVSVPMFLTNMVLVERVLVVSGFLANTWRALGRSGALADAADPDFPMLQAITLWSALLILAVGLVIDLVTARLDPRIRRSVHVLDIQNYDIYV